MKMKLSHGVGSYLTAFGFALTAGFSLACSSDCEANIQEVGASEEVDERDEWLGPSDELLRECRYYCVGYTDIQSCRFRRFVPARSTSSNGGVGGEMGAKGEAGIIEVYCTANTNDRCE